MDWKDVNWEQTEGKRYRGYIAGDEPIVVHVIKSGYLNEYVVIEEYGAYETYETYIYTSEDINEKYGIEV